VIVRYLEYIVALSRERHFARAAAAGVVPDSSGRHRVPIRPWPLLGSFGASCVLLFGYPDAPCAQPANVVLW
jgi:CBS-domain-containing membrane protein